MFCTRDRRHRQGPHVEGFGYNGYIPALAQIVFQTHGSRHASTLVEILIYGQVCRNEGPGARCRQ